MYCKDLPAVTIKDRERYWLLRDAMHAFGFSGLILLTLSLIAGDIALFGGIVCLIIWMVVGLQAQLRLDRMWSNVLKGRGHDDEEDTHS